MSPEVRPAAAAEIAAAVGVLARAFHDHPVYRHVLSDDDARRRRLPGLLHTMVVTTHRDSGPLEVAVDGDGAIVGAAAWHRPDAPEPGALRTLRSVAGMLRATGRAFPRWTALGGGIEALRPDEPHWYLFHVGVEPGHQGTGVGSTLMRSGLARTDGLAVHLECAPDLVGYYARFGFLEGVRVPLEGLDLVTMTRPARS